MQKPKNRGQKVADLEPTMSVSGGIATIWLAAPQRHNALSVADIARLRSHLSAVQADASVRVLILRARGPSFCSGHDLSHFDEGAGDPITPPDEFAGLVDTIESFPVPTICVVQGNVYGGGIDLALGFDFRIGLPAIRMSLPAAIIGIHLYPSAIRRYVSRLGLSASKRLCLLGERLNAEDMKLAGFLDALVPEDELDRAVEAMANRLLRGAPRVLSGMKVALNACAVAAADATAIDREYRASFASADLIEGLRAKREKREPVFVGR